MNEVIGVDRLLSIIPKKRFSKPRHFGTSQFAYSRFGEEDIFLFLTEFGTTTLGVDEYANMILLSGVYQIGRVNGEFKVYRYPFNLPKNPRTENQQIEREQYSDGVLFWQGLSEEAKKAWREEAVGLTMSGYNLFLKEYLLTH